MRGEKRQKFWEMRSYESRGYKKKKQKRTGRGHACDHDAVDPEAIRITRKQKKEMASRKTGGGVGIVCPEIFQQKSQHLAAMK